jgi:hypothetical protein
MATAVEIALGEYLNSDKLIIRIKEDFAGFGDEGKVISSSDVATLNSFIASKVNEKYTTYEKSNPVFGNGVFCWKNYCPKQYSIFGCRYRSSYDEC